MPRRAQPLQLIQIHFGLISRAGVLLLGLVSLPSPALTAVLTFPFAQRSEACAAHHNILLSTAASSRLPSQQRCLPAKGGQALQHFSRASTCPKNFHSIGVVRVTCLVRRHFRPHPAIGSVRCFYQVCNGG